MKHIRKLLACLLTLAALLSLCAGCDRPPEDPEKHDPTPHACESGCADCGACLDETCTEAACLRKCNCLTRDIAYNYFPVVSAEMPAIHINTEDGNSWATRYDRNAKLMGLIEYTDATVSVTGCDEEYALTDAEAEVKVRGNYTLNYAKKPIRMKFKQKSGLLGLHGGEEYKNWVLLADWKDLSMMNNTVAFYLGNTILGSDGYYCTDFRHVEVYLNGEYWGVYLLVEQQEAKDGRGGVPEVPKGYTGNDIGYFFEFDAYYDIEAALPDGDPTFTIDYCGLPVNAYGYTVKSDINANSQLAFLQKYINNAYFVVYQATQNGVYYKLTEEGDAVLDPACGSVEEAVSAVIDPTSLVDTYILNEILCDLDVDWSSFYLSLDMTAEGNRRVTFEAPWDFDSSLGMIKRRGGDKPAVAYEPMLTNPWFRLVMREEWFTALVREKWAEIKRYEIDREVFELIAMQKELYREEFIRNYTRWPDRVTHGDGEVIDLLNTYKDIETAEGLAADYLAEWLTRRLAYLDTLWSK